MGLLASLIRRTGYAKKLRAERDEARAERATLRDDLRKCRSEIKHWRSREGYPPPVSLSQAGGMRAALDNLLAHNEMVQGIPDVKVLAQRLNLVASDRDIMLKKTSASHYLATGFSALNSIYRCLPEFATMPPQRILDFGCGYGRVLRMLRAAWPHSVLVAADLEPDGLGFCMEHFDITGFRSQVRPKAVPLAHGFDLIWVGSLITHLNEDAIMGYLSLFRHLLEPDGKLVFTSHGDFVVNRLENEQFHYDLKPDQMQQVVASYRSTGFGYSDYTKSPGYGVSATSAPWLRPRVEALGRLEFTKFLPQHWDSHQDVWCFTKG